MGSIKKPEPAKLFAGIITASPVLAEKLTYCCWATPSPKAAGGQVIIRNTFKA